MKRKLPLIFILLLAGITILKAQSQYRSLGTGVTVDLSSIANWQTSPDGGNTWVAATVAPNGATALPSGSTILIQATDVWANATTGTALIIPAGVTLTNNSSAATGTFTAAKLTLSGTLVYSGTTAQTLPASASFVSSTVANITINNVAGVSTNGTLSISGIINLISGNFNCNNGGGSLNYKGTMVGTGGLINITGNFFTQGTIAQVLNGTLLLNNTINKLNVSSTTSGLINYSSTGPIKISSGIGLYAGVFTLGGTLTVTGTTITAAAGAGGITAGSNMVTFNATTAQTIPTGFFTSNNVDNITLSNALGVTSAGPLTMAASYTVTSLKSSVTPLVVTGTVTIGGTLAISSFSTVPTSGQVFTILSGTAVSGTFSNLSLPNGYSGTLAYSGTDVKLTVTPSSNANLSSLALSTGTLNPGFDPNTISYAVTVPNATTSLQITPTLSDASATMKVNGTTLASGATSSAINLNVGSNTINTVVAAFDGTVKTYTITVTRTALSTDATLSALTLNVGTLSPAFTSSGVSYTASVANAVSSLTITPTVNDATASVTVNGIAVVSGSASQSINLTVGSNTIATVVTAQDGSTKTYTITVTRTALSTDATLSSLVLSNGTLSPAFAGAVNTYTSSVANNVSNITVTPTVNDANATLTVNGTTLTSGATSGTIPLSVGVNTLTVIVTAQNGSTTQTYTILVTRQASSNADLAGLSISNGTLSPVFISATTSYTVSVANSITSFNIVPTLSDATASLTVNGTALASGNTSNIITLSVGTNTITTAVTAQDGTVKNYIITVTRQASSNADLNNFVISTGTLTPAFSAATTSYATGVPVTTASITITPTFADATATITVNGTTVTSGTASAPITINTGNNIITTIVTAQNGTTKTYTLTVSKTTLATNATLAGLALSAGTLTPVFSAATTAYAASVNNATTSVTIIPTLADVAASVKVNGSAVTSGNSSGNITLAAGSNTINTVVTAQDGITQETYTINVNRALSANANLSALTLSSGTLSPVFASSTKTYTSTVSNATSSITITPTLADATASITVNGTTVTNSTASLPIGLNVGANTITTVVKAQDGTLSTYTVTVTRISSNANLASLTLSSGTLSPVFASATNSYTASVSNATTTIMLTPTVADATASVAVNGTIVTSGNASSAIALTVGINTINVVVTAQDGATKNTYSVAVTRLPSSNANLAGLSISNGTLSPAFSTVTNSYTSSVTAATASITVTPTVSDATATIKVNGVTVSNGAASASQLLGVGNNTINVVVTAQDGTTVNTYSIVVNRPGTPQTITFGALANVTYGAADFTPTASSTNSTIPVTFTSSNTAVATITSGGAIHIIAAGSTIITASQIGNSVYSAATPVAQTLTVTPAVLTITVNNATKVYGAANPAFTAMYNGFVNNETSAVITTQPTINTTATAFSVVNAYPITATGATSANYTFTYTAGTLTVTKAALTITANNATKVYGAALPGLSVTYTGFVNGDTQASLTTQPAIATTATVASVVAGYPITANSAVAANYTINYVAGNLTVTSAPLTITANSATVTYGSAVPVLTASYTGFVNGDNTSVLTTQPVLATTYTAASVIGTYPITASGAVSANYAITYLPGVLTAGKAVLTITASNATKTYGAANPIFAVTYSGFLNGDGTAQLTTQPTITTTATTTSAVGTYPITAAGAAATNYSFVYVPATLTITGATRTFVFGPIPSHTYGDADFSAAATVNTGETITYTTSDATVATIVNGLVHIVTAGTVTITASVASNPNYIDVQPISQSYTINRAAQTISFSTLPVMQVGGAVLSLSLTSSAGLPVTISSSDGGVASVNGQNITARSVGSTIITATQAGNTNYLPAVAYQHLKVQDAVEFVKVRTGLSPNGDGVNDFLTIEGIQDYPDNKLTIVNRNGLKIYQTAGYNNLTNVFDGHSSVSGELLQAGTYFYQLELKVNGETKRKTGYIILKFN